MKVKILKASKDSYWYSDMIGEVRHVVWSKSRQCKLLKNPIKWLIDSLELEDKEESTEGWGYVYDWKDIKIVSPWGKVKIEKIKEKVYVVLAHRVYSLAENSEHSYCVGVASTLQKAVKLGEEEETYRGGKYYCTVETWEIDGGILGRALPIIPTIGDEDETLS